VKAAGGIRTLQNLEEMVLAGAHRIGTSSGKEIISQIAVRNQVP
jgi:deoxyribose-phosphate aldolase